MQNTLSEKIRIAAQDFRLTGDSQRNIVAHRLTRALLKIDPETVSVEDLRQLIKDALVGVPGAIAYVQKEQPAQTEEQQEQQEQVASQAAAKEEPPAVIEVDEDAYRVNHVVRRTSNG